MALILENIGKEVGGETHLASIDLTMASGSFNVLLGHTQAGKTSLLRILAGLDRPSSGTITLDGADITRTSVRKRSVAMVYQQFINYPSFTVRDNIASPLRLQRAGNIGERVSELAAMLHLEDLLDRLPGQLSGGQQQRVAIARALAKGADLLLLDEPLVNLDYKLREELREELRALLQNQGQPGRDSSRSTTVVYATTEPGEALTLGGDTIVMHEGRVLQHAPALQVYHRPSCVAAAHVLSDPPMNIFDAQVRAGVAEAGDMRIPLQGHLGGMFDGDYRFGIRASDCFLRRGGDGMLAVPARVELSEVSGSATFIYLRHGELRFIVEEEGVFHHDLEEELTFYLEPRKLIAFSRPGAADGHEQALVASYR